jgi:hypothetical protein
LNLPRALQSVLLCPRRSRAVGMAGVLFLHYALHGTGPYDALNSAIIERSHARTLLIAAGRDATGRTHSCPGHVQRPATLFLPSKAVETLYFRIKMNSANRCRSVYYICSKKSILKVLIFDIKGKATLASP